MRRMTRTGFDKGFGAGTRELRVVFKPGAGLGLAKSTSNAVVLMLVVAR